MQEQQQQLEGASIKVGDYIQMPRGEGFHHALVTEIDEDGDYLVVDQDGDRDTWWKNNVEKSDQEAVKQLYTILPAITRSYNGVIDHKQKVLIVGCQEIPFAKVQELAALCK